MSVGPKDCQRLRKQGEAALTALEGFSASFGKMTYDPTCGTVTCKVTFVADGADPLKADFERFAGGYGLKPEDHGREFRNGGRRFKIAGLNTRARKRPIVATEAGTGKEYVFTVESVKRGLAA